MFDLACRRRPLLSERSPDEQGTTTASQVEHFEARSGLLAGLGPRLGGLDLTNGRISCQIRLAEHAALACVRDCVADLENPSASISAAGVFQVRQQESKAGEQAAFRKSGG